MKLKLSISIFLIITFLTFKNMNALNFFLAPHQPTAVDESIEETLKIIDNADQVMQSIRQGAQRLIPASSSLIKPALIIGGTVVTGCLLYKAFQNSAFKQELKNLSDKTKRISGNAHSLLTNSSSKKRNITLKKLIQESLLNTKTRIEDLRSQLQQNSLLQSTLQQEIINIANSNTEAAQKLNVFEAQEAQYEATLNEIKFEYELLSNNFRNANREESLRATTMEKKLMELTSSVHNETTLNKKIRKLNNLVEKMPEKLKRTISIENPDLRNILLLRIMLQEKMLSQNELEFGNDYQTPVGSQVNSNVFTSPDEFEVD